MPVDDRGGIIYRLDDVVRPIYIGRSYHLDVSVVDTLHLRYERGDILIYVVCKHGLYHEDVRVSFNGLHHPEIIHVAVVIEVQVGEHIRGVVQQVLEFLDGG